MKYGYARLFRASDPLRSFAEARARGARLDGFGLALKSGVGCETGVEILQCMKPCKAS